MLNGKKRYMQHFQKDQLPPERYWRISMYDIEGFVTNNPINRYGFSNMAEKPKLDADGGPTGPIQHGSPESLTPAFN